MAGAGKQMQRNVKMKKVRRVEMVKDIMAWVDCADRSAAFLGSSAIEAKNIAEAVRPLEFLSNQVQTISLTRYKNANILINQGIWPCFCMFTEFASARRKMVGDRQGREQNTA